MLFAYVVGIAVSVDQEMGGSKQIAAMEIRQDMGSMEGAGDPDRVGPHRRCGA